MDLCSKMGVDGGEWRDLVSSDDSYTAHAFPSRDITGSRMKILLFLRAQEVCERAMNIWTSPSKSSISMLIYEFNSMFGSNMSMHPVTFKFALSSVHPVNTDSFFRMVKESYIASRQIVENGGSLELYVLASKLNKQYCESIYHTHAGGQNDLEKHSLRRDFVPYQLGIYPIMDPGLMIMFGPECHNYNILMNKEDMTEREKQLFGVSHTLVGINDPEVYAAATSVDDIFVGVNRIEAHMGPITRLERIKRNTGYTWDELNKRVIEDPLMLFNDPKDMEDLKTKVFLKLYRFGAAEALRTTAASIYYGRVAATVSANAFTVPFSGHNEPETYNQCLVRMLNMTANMMDIQILYPHLPDYQNIHRLSQLISDYGPRNPLETQNMRNLQLNKLQQRISNPVIDLLNHYWRKEIMEPPTSYIRDWINLKESAPLIKDTMRETLDLLPGDRDARVRSLMLVILRLMGYSTRPMKAIIYGPSSRAYDSSYLVLKQQNLYTHSTSTSMMGHHMSSIITKHNDRLSFAINYFLLSCLHGTPINVNHLIHEEDIDSFFLDNSIGISTHKKALLALIYLGRISNISAWSNKTKTFFHKWVVRSKMTPKGYSGDFILKIQIGGFIMQCSYIQSSNRYAIVLNRVDDLHLAHELIAELASIIGINLEELVRRLAPGQFILTSDTILSIPNKGGFHMIIKPLSNIVLNPDKIVIEKEMITLYDIDESIILRTILGLLQSDYIPDESEIKEDVLLQGISLKKLTPYRPFSADFSINTIPNKTLCQILCNDEPIGASDIMVPEPMVSEVTNQRLGINYRTRDNTSDFAEVQIESHDEGKDFKMSDVVNWIIPDIRDLLTEREDSFHDVWLDPSFDMNILKTMTRQTITYHPRKILERLINIKYQIITKLCTNVNMINKQTIIAAKNVTGNKSIVDSLIYSYDRQFTNRDVPSPHGCELTIYPLFDERYHVQKISTLSW